MVWFECFDQFDLVFFGSVECGLIEGGFQGGGYNGFVFFVYIGQCVVYEVNLVVLNIGVYYFGSGCFQIFVVVGDDQLYFMQVLISQRLQEFVLEDFCFVWLNCDVQNFLVFVCVDVDGDYCGY